MGYLGPRTDRASDRWSEGVRIGASASGLEAPLKAVIKNTKLGLGAQR